MKKFLKNNFAMFFKKIYLLPVMMALSIISCKKDIAPLSENETALADEDMVTDEASASRFNHPYIFVHSGTSIQAAVDKAVAGTTIFIEPGVYKDSVQVSKAGIHLVGLAAFGKKVIIENPGDEENGIKVTDEGDGFVLKNVTIQGFEDNGIILIRVDNFVLDHISSINNKEYGLFPVRCSHGVIRFCSATGSSDTGIYVGQSTDVAMQFNKAFGNVSGFEIENCTNVTASWNEAYNNSAGISVFLLPGLSVTTASNNTVSHNNIHDNNLPHFDTGGGLEDVIPVGCGILMVGADNTTIERNTIVRNNFVGIAVVSTSLLGALTTGVPVDYPDIEENPDGTKIVGNIVKLNGSVAPVGLPLPAADLLWDGSGNGSCWKNNKFTVAVPADLPVCL